MQLHVIDKDIRDRASKPLSVEPRPFLRWAGSKRLLLKEIVSSIPSSYGTYYEPFLGGGSLFFLLEPSRAHVSDVLGDLIRTYSAVRDDPDEVVRRIEVWSVDRDTYYRVRAYRPRKDSAFAARFIYLNKVGWNGLYRVNSSGQFNVPFGRPKTDTVVDGSNLRSCARALSQPGVRLSTGDFLETTRRASPGDLVFLDPPYVTGHTNNGFVDYNQRLFNWDDQLRLAQEAERLRVLGAHVIVANAAHRSVVDLYPAFTPHYVAREQTISGAPSGRVSTTEVFLIGSRNGGTDG